MQGKCALQNGSACLALSQQTINHMLPAHCQVCRLDALRAVWSFRSTLLCLSQAGAQALKIPRRRSDQSTGTSCSCKISSPASVRRTGRTGSRRAASCVQPSPRPAGRAWPPVMRISCPTLDASCPTTLGDAFATQPALNSWLAPHEVKCSDCGLSPISGGNPVKKCQCRYMLCGPLIKAMSCAQDIWLW